MGEQPNERTHACWQPAVDRRHLTGAVRGSPLRRTDGVRNYAARVSAGVPCYKLVRR